ncbi:cytochrome P450 [Cubamyces sp. BRFM 1775]|nr:cytochrome P450 [Cubamyces sp. BRFM 1775]
MGYSSVLSGIDLALCYLVLLYIAYQSASVLYNVFLSPLSAIPGPWYAAATDIWLLYHAAQFKQCGALHSMLQRYGPIVRVGPRKVVFCDTGAIKSVYCVNKLHKSSFYKALVADDHDHSMTSLTNVEHAKRRRSFASHYALAHVAGFQPDINGCITELVELLEASPHTSLDCIHLLRHLLVDILRATVFGLSPIALKHWASGEEDTISTAVRDFPMRAILHSFIPTSLWNASAYLPCRRWREIYHADSVLATFVRARLQELRRDALDVDAKSSDKPVPLMHRMLSQRSFGRPDGLSDQDIVSECISHLVAGVDTSTATFGFIMWELSRRPDVVQRLRTELDQVMPDRRTIPDYTALMKQAYLTAFLNEGFRMYGAVSSFLERTVSGKDEASASLSQRDAFDLMGYAIPPGTVVGTQAWSVHRDPDIYPFPETFDPERWLPANASVEEEERLKLMSQCFMPFGAGTRACPGRHQAQLVFRIVVAAIVLNFDIHADPLETNEETMAMRDAFAVRPASRECRLSFVPRP